MKQFKTQLLDKEIELLKLVFIAERFRNSEIKISPEIFNYLVQDDIVAICKHEDKYLIGRYREDHDFCPGDWDFLTKRIHGGCDLSKEALEIPVHYAGLKPKNIVCAYHSFMWLDSESKLWWHFLPFKIETVNDNIIVKPNEKFCEFRWVSKEDLSKHSRIRYFEHVLSKTLGADHLYVYDYTTIFDKKRGFYNFFPFRE